MKQIFLFFGVMILFFSCKKDVNTESTILPTIDTIITGTVIFKEPAQIFYHNNMSVTVARSCPCNPSNEIYFFTANTPTITDTLNTTYTWTIRMATTYIMQGKKMQFVFERAGTWKVELEVKTNGVVVDTMSVTVTPYGQKANNRNISIHADCINSNKKYFVSLYSTHNVPLDGSVNAIYWDFGDGTHLTDTNYIQHKFPIIQKDTTYIVKLFINNTSGCKDSTSLNVFVPATYINDNGAYIDTVKFTWTQSDACYPNSEEFTFIADTSKMPANAIYLWDFKDYVRDIPGKIATHKFTFPNRYDVTLRVMHNGRMISEWYDTTVRAKGQFVTPIAYFYSSVEQDTLDTVRRFFNCQSKFDNGGFLDTVVYNFGDGTIIGRPRDDYNARHTYHKQATAKEYLVKMVITANSGCKDSSYTKVIIPKL